MLPFPMFRTHRPFPIFAHPLTSFRIPASADLCELCTSAFRSLSCFTLSLFCRNSAKISPSFSYCSALFKKECFNNSFPINSFRTLSQNPAGDTHPPKIFYLFFPILAFRQLSPTTNSRRIRTYEKTGEGAPAGSFSSAPETDPQHPSVTLIGVPFWERPCGNGGMTRVKTLGR
jgi:hypothetical protein